MTSSSSSSSPVLVMPPDGADINKLISQLSALMPPSNKIAFQPIDSSFSEAKTKPPKLTVIGSNTSSGVLLSSAHPPRSLAQLDPYLNAWAHYREHPAWRRHPSEADAYILHHTWRICDLLVSDTSNNTAGLSTWEMKQQRRILGVLQADLKQLMRDAELIALAAESLAPLLAANKGRKATELFVASLHLDVDAKERILALPDVIDSQFEEENDENSSVWRPPSLWAFVASTGIVLGVLWWLMRQWRLYRRQSRQ